MEPLSVILLWIVIGFFVNYKWELLPFKENKKDNNTLAVLFFIFSPLVLVASLFVIIFIKKWNE